MSLISELKRRKVFKVGAAYLVVGWLVIEVASTVMPQFDVPEWAPRLVTLLIALGLPIALVMAWVFDVTPEGLKVDASRVGSKRLFGVAALLAALALGWFFHDHFEPATPAPSADNPPPAASADSASVAAKPEATTQTSIAVLPFVDMSQAKDQEYFSDGLSEELLNLLAQLPQLRVIARTSSFSFKGKEVDVATIAKALGVAHVLEGSVRKSGKTLRITAQLIRASDSSHLWSQTYDRELTDIFKVQDEIAGAVVDALKLQLLPSQALTNPNRSSNTEAYNQFLRDCGKLEIPVASYDFHPGNTYTTAVIEAPRGYETRQFKLDDFRNKVEKRMHDRDYPVEEIWANYEYFMKATLPVAKEAGVRMSLHPDDPPLAMMNGVGKMFVHYDGYARAERIAEAIEGKGAPHWGLTFCVGTWSEGGDKMGKDVFGMIEDFGRRGKLCEIHFRAVSAPLPEFYETFPEEGYLDLYKVMKALRKVKFAGAVMPDHVPALAGDEGIRRAGTAYCIAMMRAMLRRGNEEVG